jgi:hypothetical protein
MKKFFLFCMMALVAMCGLNSCSDDCDHDFIEHDHSADLVGTWTCLQEGLAEAFVIKADGSVVSTGVLDGEYWDGIKGSIKTVNNKMTFTYEGGDNYETRFDIIPGVAFSVFNEEGERLTYNYCANDLADEIVGMWVCNDASSAAQDMMIQTFYDNGKCTLTGYLPLQDDSEQVKNEATDYKVIGDLLFISIPAEKVGGENPIYVVDKLVYTPNGTAYGDMLSLKTYPEVEGKIVETTLTFLRVKQNLNLAGKAYDYSATYLTNAKGEDKDIPFLDTSFNFAKMNGSIIDKFLKSILFNVEFPDANTIKYSYLLEGQNMVMTAPIEVEGNKMTIKMSETIPVYQDVEIYTFQDQDNTQMHLFIPTASFEKFFANTSVAVMLGHGQLDINDADAIAGVYQTVADALESINLTIILK